MIKNLRKITATLSLCILAQLTLSAQDFIAIAKDGNVYDEANAKYITVNQNNDDVSIIPGMVFPVSDHTPGWYKVEYSPGLHAFIPEQIAASNFKQPQPGSYQLTNNPGIQLKVEGSGDNWTASTGNQTYKGLRSQDILVFYDNNNNLAYSLVDIGNGPIAVTYDNAVTKFF